MNTTIKDGLMLAVIFLLGWISYTQYQTNNQLEESLSKTEQEFIDFRVKINKRVDSLQNVMKDYSKHNNDYINFMDKLKRDVDREHLLLKKPKLVEKMINKSFKEFTDSITELTSHEN